MRSFILPLLGYAGYPMIVLGAIGVFGLSSLFTLEMVSAHVVASIAPVASSPDFNLPPVQQIGSLAPAPVDPDPAPEEAAPESSIAEVAPPSEAVAVSVARPLATTFAAVETTPAAGSSRIGAQAVNVRASPSKTGVVLGVLNAGSPVRTAENVGGWIHVYFEGGDGWVYQDFLE
jgi:hypothetical protein